MRIGAWSPPRAVPPRRPSGRWWRRRWHPCRRGKEREGRGSGRRGGGEGLASGRGLWRYAAPPILPAPPTHPSQSCNRPIAGGRRLLPRRRPEGRPWRAANCRPPWPRPAGRWPAGGQADRPLWPPAGRFRRGRSLAGPLARFGVLCAEAGRGLCGREAWATGAAGPLNPHPSPTTHTPAPLPRHPHPPPPPQTPRTPLPPAACRRPTRSRPRWPSCLPSATSAARSWTTQWAACAPWWPPWSGGWKSMGAGW